MYYIHRITAVDKNTSRHDITEHVRGAACEEWSGVASKIVEVVGPGYFRTAAVHALGNTTENELRSRVAFFDLLNKQDVWKRQADTVDSVVLYEFAYVTPDHTIIEVIVREPKDFIDPVSEKPVTVKAAHKPAPRYEYCVTQGVRFCSEFAPSEFTATRTETRQTFYDAFMLAQNWVFAAYEMSGYMNMTVATEPGDHCNHVLIDFKDAMENEDPYYIEITRVTV